MTGEGPWTVDAGRAARSRHGADRRPRPLLGPGLLPILPPVTADRLPLAAAANTGPLAVASAPGKLILLGEHAVVYGRTAVAVPVQAVRARATVWPAADGPLVEAHFPEGSGRAPARVDLASPEEGDPIAVAVATALRAAGGPAACRPSWRIDLESTIPVASGLGSSAAVAVALVRAVSLACGAAPSDEMVAAMALEAERRTHGRPSGIDNTVVALGRPIRYHQGEITRLAAASPVHLVVAHSGQLGLTREMVAAVGVRRALEPARHEEWFDHIGALAEAGCRAIETGDLELLGRLLDANHELLQQLGVSTPALDRLVAAAREAGALGAKLSGAGGGGVMVALVAAAQQEAVAGALEDAGALPVLATTVPAGRP
jgi:mevalonate kinase